MKKLLLVLALITALPIGAFAASCNSDTDKFSSDQWCINSEDTLIPSPSAGEQVIYENYTTANTNNTLTAGESGKRITDTGGASGPTVIGYGSKHILPRAAVGLVYTFSTGGRTVITVDTLDTSDTILHSISGTGLDAGDSIKSSGQAGESVTVYSPAANKWAIQGMNGSWSDNSTN